VTDGQLPPMAARAGADPTTPDTSSLDSIIAETPGVPSRTTASGPRRLLRRAYSGALLVAGSAVLAARWEQVGELVAGARPGPLAAALALGLVSLGQSAWFWTRGLTALGAARPMGDVLDATVAAIPARYLPGSIWYAAGRVGHLRRSGTPAVALATVAAVETLLSFMIAVALGSALLLLGGTTGGSVGVAGLVVLAGGLALVASPWVVNPVLRWTVARKGIHAPPVLRWRAYLELCAHLVAFWAASAAAFLCYLASFPAIHTPGIARTAGTFLMAWAAGFVAVFAPQGAGVFETTLAGLLTGAPVAALAVVIAGYRALTAVRDGLALASLAALRSLSSRRPADQVGR